LNGGVYGVMKRVTCTVAVLMATLSVAPALADKGGVPNGGDGTDNPNAAQPAQPATPAEPTVAPATPATPAQPAEKSKKARAVKPAKADRPARTRKPKKAKAPKPAPTATGEEAKAGRTTICHATGSDTNPYATITVSDNALKAHARHHDGGDIIPAPSEGCPESALEETSAPAQETTIPPATGEGATAAVAGSSTEQRPSGIAVLGVSDTRAGTSAAPPAARVAGVSDTLEVAEASDDETGTVAGLPFTGLELGLLAALGLAALLAGTALRRTLVDRTTH
jgi:hypothetical protein